MGLCIDLLFSLTHLKNVLLGGWQGNCCPGIEVQYHVVFQCQYLQYIEK